MKKHIQRNSTSGDRGRGIAPTYTNYWLVDEMELQSIRREAEDNSFSFYEGEIHCSSYVVDYDGYKEHEGVDISGYGITIISGEYPAASYVDKYILEELS